MFDTNMCALDTLVGDWCCLLLRRPGISYSLERNYFRIRAKCLCDYWLAYFVIRPNAPRFMYHRQERKQNDDDDDDKTRARETTPSSRKLLY